jgi:hypothetical protein
MDEPGRMGHPPSGRHMQPHVRRQRRSGAEARDLLERELATVSASPEHDRHARFPHPGLAPQKPRRASPVLEYLPEPPEIIVPRRALAKKPIRPGSLMEALSAAKPSASDLSDFDKHSIERPARPAPVSRRRLPRTLVTVFGLAFIGLAGYSIFNKGIENAKTKPPEMPVPAIVSSGLPANVPLPVRRRSVRPDSMR